LFVKGINGEKGEVISVHGNKANVKIKANESCEKCGICKKVSDTEMVIDAFVEGNVKEGEIVNIAIRPGIIVKSAFILYIFPLIGLIFGYYLGKFINSSFFKLEGELFSAFFSIIFLFLSFIPIKIYDRIKQNDKKFKVYIKGS